MRIYLRASLLPWTMLFRFLSEPPLLSHCRRQAAATLDSLAWCPATGKLEQSLVGILDFPWPSLLEYHPLWGDSFSPLPLGWLSPISVGCSSISHSCFKSADKRRLPGISKEEGVHPLNGFNSARTSLISPVILGASAVGGQSWVPEAWISSKSLCWNHP